jgi:Heavy metal binding domain
MHPEVVSDKPGTCPKCGMTLEPMMPRPAETKTIYTCPMHPEVEQDHPGQIIPMAVSKWLELILSIPREYNSDEAPQEVHRRFASQCPRPTIQAGDSVSHDFAGFRPPWWQYPGENGCSLPAADPVPDM